MTEAGWMPLAEFCEKYQQRKNTVTKRVFEGIWPRGEYYSSPSGGAAFVHEERAAAWLRARKKLPQ